MGVLRSKKHFLGHFNNILVLTLPTRDPFDTNPPDGEHGRVMIHVEERDLIVLLTQDEEKRVHELYTLREVIPPQSLGNLQTERQMCP